MNLPITTILAFLPELGTSVLVVLLLATLFVKGKAHTFIQWCVPGALLLLMVAARLIPSGAVNTFAHASFVVDQVTVLGRMLLMLSGAAIVLFALVTKRFPREFFVLVLLSLLGGLVAIGAQEMLLLYVAIELLSFPGYILVAFGKDKRVSVEAAVKYLLFGVVATAMLLYGFALLIGSCGDTTFSGIAQCVANSPSSESILLVPFALILLGLGFKIGTVPAQAWLPDTYTGAPVEVTGFLASVGKISILLVLFRLFGVSLLGTFQKGALLIIVLGVTTLVFGTTAALFQKNFRRLLAYSGIGHVGFMMCLFPLGMVGFQAFSWYLISYIVATIGIFAYLTFSSLSFDQDSIEAHQGRIKSNPQLGISVVVLLLSMAGLPPLLGFWGKFGGAVSVMRDYPVPAGWLLAGALLVVSVVSFFYYLSVIRQLISSTENSSTQPKKECFSVSLLSYIAIGAAVFLVVGGIVGEQILTLFGVG
ncbi:MAG: NADH-quinone oxidoreductase subunit N [bacterium]